MRKGIFIKEENVKFIVKEEERKVICILDKTAHDALRIINHMSNIYMANFNKNRMMPDKFVGIATCALEDTWDEKTGKAVAFNKVCEKYYKSLFKRLNTYVQDIDYELNKAINEINTYGARVGRILDAKKEHLDKILEVEEKN